MEALKRHPLTLGIAVGLLVILATVILGAWRAQAQVDATAERAVQRHEQRDLDVAHPASKRLHERLDRIDDRLRDAREALKRIEGRLSK